MSTNRNNSTGGLITGLFALAVVGGLVFYLKHKSPDVTNYSQTNQPTQSTYSTRPTSDESHIEELLQQSANIKKSNSYTASDGKIYSLEKGKTGKIIGTNYEVRASYLIEQENKAKAEEAKKAAQPTKKK